MHAEKAFGYLERLTSIKDIGRFIIQTCPTYNDER